jgi:hypothetical protein
VVPYYGLAKGFLTGKYRPGGDAVRSPRAEAARTYLDSRGVVVLEVLDAVAAAHQTTVAPVAPAWLCALEDHQDRGRQLAYRRPTYGMAGGSDGDPDELPAGAGLDEREPELDG